MKTVIIIFSVFVISSINSYGQVTVANQEKYTVVASAQNYSTTFPYNTIGLVSLTDLDSTVARVSQQSANFTGVHQWYIKINSSGATSALTKHFLTSDHSITTGGLVMSQSEQYYYYVYTDYITTNNSWIMAQQSINNGILSISYIYAASANQRLYSSIATNNKGTVATVVENLDPVSRQPLSYQIIRISNQGQIAVLDTISLANFSHGKFYINELDTVFVQSWAFPYSLFAYNNLGSKSEIAQGVSYYGNENYVQTTNITTTAHPEGVVYYLASNRIVNSEGVVILDFNVLNPNLRINSFFVTADLKVYSISTSGLNNSIFLMKNNENLVTSGQVLLGNNLNSIESLRGNNNGDIVFKAISSVPNASSIERIIKYSGDSKKAFKIAKTISILRNNILTPVSDPDHFQMAPTVDTRGTVCRQNYSPSRIRIKIECQSNVAPYENIAGCQIQMQKALGTDLGGHFEITHNNANRPLGHFSNNQVEQQFIEIPIDGLSFNYEAPEPSGEIDLNFVAFGPDNKGIEVAKSVAQVKIGNLVSLADVSYLTMQNTGHLTEDETEEGGVYSTTDFRTNLGEALELYYQRSLREGIPEHEIVLLTSEAASLAWGGLYDIDHDWNPSHCGHRIGNAIDLGMASFRLSTSPNRQRMLNILHASLLHVEFRFPVRSESPAIGFNNHWHTQLD